MAIEPATVQSYKTPEGDIVDVTIPNHESQFPAIMGVEVGQVVVAIPIKDADGNVVDTADTIWDRVPKDWELVSEDAPAVSKFVEDNKVDDGVLVQTLENLDTGAGGYYSFEFDGDVYNVRGKDEALAFLRTVPAAQLPEVTVPEKQGD